MKIHGDPHVEKAGTSLIGHGMSEQADLGSVERVFDQLLKTGTILSLRPRFCCEIILAITEADTRSRHLHVELVCFSVLRSFRRIETERIGNIAVLYSLQHRILKAIGVVIRQASRETG